MLSATFFTGYYYWWGLCNVVAMRVAAIIVDTDCRIRSLSEGEKRACMQLRSWLLGQRCTFFVSRQQNRTYDAILLGTALRLGLEQAQA